MNLRGDPGRRMSIRYFPAHRGPSSNSTSRGLRSTKRDSWASELVERSENTGEISCAEASSEEVQRGGGAKRSFCGGTPAAGLRHGLDIEDSLQSRAGVENVNRWVVGYRRRRTPVDDAIDDDGEPG
jgi:hypothetical protein